MEIVSTATVDSVEIDTVETDAVEVADGIHLTKGAAGEQTSVQRVYIEPGAKVPEHEHPHEQSGIVTGGTMRFVVDGEEHVLREGDTYTIPGGVPHAVINEKDIPAEGYDVFSPPRENPDWSQ